ncbi:hypothetical protein PR003_g27223 [Phytophthora rubi]|uniref:Uncharacterized protein n=1 Tax=Phytophthora rubi TaxID=129364 RepID=A0A6A4C8Q3_9STRA|nr:hypothetical protein PR003_g27223 [Phytophthora rubi]
MSAPSSPGSPSRPPPPTEASADELRRRNTLLQGCLAHADPEPQRVASSRNATADEQHRLSRTLLRQTHELRVLEDLYRARQEEIGHLRAEIAAFQEPEDPGVGVNPRVACLESQLRQHKPISAISRRALIKWSPNATFSKIRVTIWPKKCV